MTESLYPPFVVKVCGIRSEDEARAAVAAGANALGFNFYRRSPRYIAPEVAQQIVCHLPDAVLKVGVFVEPSAMEIEEMLAHVSLDVVQLHGAHAPTVPCRTWRALVAEKANPAESLAAEAILLDAHTPHFGGSGKTFDWKIATRFWQPLILAGGLDAANVAEAMELVRPWGVDACSKLESAPGRKDTGKVKSFVKAALSASHYFRSISVAQQ
jgi:phosphoribosylanthranilate isomerase